MIWTNEQIELLKNNFTSKTNFDISLITGHTKKSVEAKAKILGLRKKAENAKYSEEELKFLSENYKTKTTKELSIILGKTIDQIFEILRKLGLKKDKYIPPSNWTEEQIKFLKENYLQMTSQEIAQKINKSKWAVENKVKKLKLKKGPGKFIRTLETRKKLSDAFKGRIFTKEHLAKIKISRNLPENKEKMRKITQARWDNGYKHSKEVISKMSESILKGDPIKRKERCRKAAIASRKAQASRNGPTSIEKIVMDYLIINQIKYFWEHEINKFLVDFYIPSVNLVIECDGSYWHSLSNKIAYDQYKTESLINMGINVIRLSEKSIKNSDFINELDKYFEVKNNTNI